jgi:hypothetical protein
VHSTQHAVRSTQHAEKRQKRVKKISKGGNDRKRVFFPSTFWQKVFVMCFPKKVFGGVFELLPLLRNAQKRHKKKYFLPRL